MTAMAKILFCDDDMNSLQILGKAAEILGHKPILVNNGKQVLEEAGRAQPDLILVDMFMPDMDGIEILGKLKANPATANIPVLILSAGATSDLKHHAQSSGAQGFIVKPINLGVLRDTINNYCPVKSYGV